MNKRHRSVIKWSLILVAMVAAVALADADRIKFFSRIMTQQTSLDRITVNFPGKALFPLDPRKIYSIGDQVIAEHIFGYHAQESKTLGFTPLLSEVVVNSDQRFISFKPRYELKDASGEDFLLSKICESLRESIKGTTHAHYSDMVERFECKNGIAKLHLNYVPVNLRFLFTLPDFSIFDHKSLPISGTEPVHSTGPYSFDSLDESGSVLLKINPYFPKELRANSVREVLFKPYIGTPELAPAEDWSPERDHLIYIMPILFGSDYTDKLKEVGYQIRISPVEGLLFLDFIKAVPLDIRRLIGATIDRGLRDQVTQGGDYLYPAFSMQPADRGYGLTSSEYFQVLESDLPPKRTLPKLGKKFVFGTTEMFYKNSRIKNFVDSIVAELSDVVELRLYKKGEFEAFDREVDFYINSVGLSQADPISHLFFLKKSYPSFDSSLSIELLKELAKESDPSEFSRRLKEIEKLFVKERLFIPIAHFPGVTAESPLLEVDERLQWSWGTAAWTYRVQ